MKRLLIINGIPEEAIANDPSMMEYEQNILDEMKARDDVECHYFTLRDMNINYCTGCWSCWLKTPGLCSIKDEYEEIMKRIPHMDEIVIITPVIAGYESALIKKFKDRFIPSAMPYIRIHKGEMHHYQRYSKEVEGNFNLLLLTDDFTTDEDINIIKHTYERVALNFECTLKPIYTSREKGGLNHVISHI